MLMHSIRENGAALGRTWWQDAPLLAGVNRLGDLPTPVLRLLAHTVHRAGWLLDIERVTRTP